ncbi:hypothetical protein [Mumia zhuanghuii]|uniref:Uncharacterized protein n=1 Tax=Mumia zhuanghuii TaxID=2585211 RepID=A0A5C4M9L0_9ACTN|nr:hypothetical protein [Mumia zhuanghuii]TNC31323.1 hypothetical protein FHE65_32150 [Mumia zhuanghuii]
MRRTHTALDGHGQQRHQVPVTMPRPDVERCRRLKAKSCGLRATSHELRFTPDQGLYSPWRSEALEQPPLHRAAECYWPLHDLPCSRVREPDQSPQRLLGLHGRALEQLR